MDSVKKEPECNRFDCGNDGKDCCLNKKWGAKRIHCHEILEATIRQFARGGNYENLVERGRIFQYWHLTGLEKQVCDDCQGAWNDAKKQWDNDRIAELNEVADNSRCQEHNIPLCKKCR